MNLRMLAAAEREALKAGLWYDKQQPGLGDDFLDELDQALKSIEENPESFWVMESPRSKRVVRCCLLKQFPFANLL